MKKKNILLSIITFFTFSFFTSQAQNWVRMMSDPRVNFYDVQKAFNEWNEQRKTEKHIGINQKEDEDNYQLYKRWEWYMEPRVYPTGNIPTSNYTADNYKVYKARHADERTAQTNSLASWQYAGNKNVPLNGGGDGRVNRIVLYPGNDSIMFACSPQGGLWKSTNAGATWSTNTDQLVSIATEDLAINPLNPRVMYLATGDGDGWGLASIGVLKTSDGGNNWDTTGLYYQLQSSGPAYVIGTRILINPSDTSLLLAGMTSGIYLSRNSGLTWTQVLGEDAKSIEFEPFHSSTVYVGTYNGTYYRSTDSGATFTQDTVGLPPSGMGRITVGVSPADSNVVYLLAENPNTSGFFGLYMSTDRGQSFKPRSLFSKGAQNLLGWAPSGRDSTGQGWYTLSLAVSPTNVDTVLVGGVNIWMSADSGKIWQLAGQWEGIGAPYVHADIHEIIFSQGSGARYYTACDGGVFTKSASYAGNWTNISNNLEIAQQYSIGLSATTPGYWISGWQDNGTNLSRNPWTQTIGGDGMVCFIDYTTDSYLYGSYQNGALEFSSNDGVSWNSATGAITESGPWTTRWLEDPAQPGMLFAGYKNIWQTSTYGTYWGQVTTWGNAQINSLVISPTSDNYMYASQGNQLFGTSNGGVTWNVISAGLPLGLASCSALEVDPADPNHIWAVLSGWVPTAKVYESHNGGASWRNITAGLPNLPVNCIVAQPGSPQGIYIGTDIGVYYRDTILNSWINYSNGLPNVMVDDLKIFAPSNTLVAATYGRGTWEVQTYVAVGVNEISLDQGIKVYPNPTSGKVQVKFSMLSGNYNLIVADMLGRTISTDKINVSGEYTHNLDLSGYGKGIYFVEISNAGKKMVRKVVVY